MRAAQNFVAFSPLVIAIPGTDPGTALTVSYLCVRPGDRPRSPAPLRMPALGAVLSASKSAAHVAPPFFCSTEVAYLRSLRRSSQGQFSPSPLPGAARHSRGPEASTVVVSGLFGCGATCRTATPSRFFLPIDDAPDFSGAQNQHCPEATIPAQSHIHGSGARGVI